MVLRAIVVMVAASSLFATASPADAGSLADCGQRVIRDWYSGGRVDKLYPLPCYREAIRALPDDVLQYTDAGAAIERALERARHGEVDRSTSVPTEPSKPTTPPPIPRARGTDPQGPPPRIAARRTHDPVRLASAPQPETGGDAGIPYPLVALAALAPVLLASGLAGALMRRRR